MLNKRVFAVYLLTSMVMLSAQKLGLDVDLGPISISVGQEDIVLCTFYTPSHKRLAETWLLPTIEKKLPYIIGNGDQHCSSATYQREGWRKTTREKISFLLETMRNHVDGIVIFSDADVTLFRPIKDEIISLLQDKDFVGQKDRPGKLCSGFFALRVNDKTTQLWEAILEYMKANPNISDQDALRHFLREDKNTFDLAWDYLPDAYFGGGTFNPRGWKPGTSLFVPENPAMFHANYTHYVHKHAMLTYVRGIVEARNNT